MNMTSVKQCVQFAVDFRLRTPLLLRSDEEGDFSDSVIERTPDGKVHVNGYVWASLLRRALGRIDGADSLVERIGRYGRDEKGRMDNLGISTLWCGTTIAQTQVSDVRPGNKIDRQWGSVVKKALYSEEVEVPGAILTLEGNLFCAAEEQAEDLQEKLKGALWVINEGIENVGGGWSYGCGRLLVEAFVMETLDLESKNSTPKEKGDVRKRLWDFSVLKKEAQALTKPAIKGGKGWTQFTVEAEISPGQLLAIHSSQPDYERYQDWPHLPDTFVFRSVSLMSDKRVPVVAGKAFRQAVLSMNIERNLRTEGAEICDTPGERCTCPICVNERTAGKKIVRSDKCSCQRCHWFGSTDQGGIIAVLDAPVRAATTDVLHRIQLCEHSFQNIQLFSGEYLTGGAFIPEIFVDEGQSGKETDKLIGYIRTLLGEMGPEEIAPGASETTNNSGEHMAPPGWYRLGATTACTGQFTVKQWRVNHVRR